MANTVGPILAPLVDAWNWYTKDHVLESLIEFKGGAQQHNTWHTKYLRSEKDQLNTKFVSLEKRWNQDPELSDIASDNLARLTFFSGMDRVISIRQGFSVLKQRFFLPVNTSGTLGEVLNLGWSQGYFKGAILNAVQFLGVQYNTILWARGADWKTQWLMSSLFETVFHPIDTVKTILYADTQGTYKGALDVLGRVVQEQQIYHLTRGLAFKLIYNSFFLAHLRNFYEDNNWQYLTTPLWIFSYGFLAVKTRLQVANTALSYQSAIDLAGKGAEKGLYRGVMPFVAINYFFSFQLYGLYSKEAQDKEVSGLRKSLAENFSSPIPEKNWSA